MTLVLRSVALAALVTTTGCGKEQGRIPFSAEGNAESVVTLKAGEVAFWTDLDIEYEGDAVLHHNIVLVQDGKSVASANCNPLGRMPAKMGWVETNLGDAHTRRGSGKMECAATVPAAGATTAKVSLVFSKKPAKLTLKKADLVLKQ